ncbi:peptidase M19 [Pacificitalea manganoxidans]|uniref:Peptidase M19 n=1 Tax=Pacificitalea manganoxidans TaxID=1411902 RepID=A0A291LWZ0_9RHOB|nr:membrane dipeptidase [Pacificitalea manganoxidans]ATI41157.1 peptidase M19 [Pacificitalea manganoxidans]MBF53326.1 peptidase M19 [Actibacterium sp.]MDR6308532.1 microsomal dipeptidase-like Zn-dependent dipeptidase [Pacificitalea manganoxidans]OWU69306.1 peptidase M19 [Roseovarius sp. 22II1-1F6A]
MTMIDGLECGPFDRESFLRLKAAGVHGVVVTCGFWEGALESLDSLGRWRDLVRDNADVTCMGDTPEAIERAAEEGRVAAIMGFQNANLFEGRIRLVEMFAELGVRVVQLTYNNQNELAGSCYEAEDSGLSRFGAEVVREMNRQGMLIDCSHVGDRSTLDAIKASEKPVAVTHANAASLFPHKRNKSDKVLHALRDTGGVIGCAAYRNITGDYYSGPIEQWCEMVARTVEIAGIDSVAIGTDRGHNMDRAIYDWMRMGRWTRGVDYGAASAARPGKAPPPDWFQELEDMRVIPDGLRSVGFNNEEVEKILHGNWMRLYRATFRTSDRYEETQQ